MYRLFNDRLRRLLDAGDPRILQGGKTGLEKESLRVAPSGDIATTPHPEALGAALTHPHITTDYSEALLEFVTAPSADLAEPLKFLEAVHRFVYGEIGDELLWVTSMPCVVAGDDRIPIARFGTSNSGTMKTVYRRGLRHRYGGLMQVIAGVHFNYSLPEPLWAVYRDLVQHEGPLQSFIDDAYFALIRNVLRFSWLILYLFGSSPAVCRTFLRGREGRFAKFDESTFYEPYATSLRMSDIGYTNTGPAGLDISHDDLAHYVASLTRAIETPHPEYLRLGVIRDGEYLQLNANLLQIENEYYSPVRPKRPPKRGERPTVALGERGVEYVELRALDLDPFSPTGVNEAELRFLEAFLIFCVLHESPRIGGEERREIDRNLGEVATRGREPGLFLRRAGRDVVVRGWATELLEELDGVCEALDADRPIPVYGHALMTQKERVADPEATPSARILEEMRVGHEGFFDFALRRSRLYRDELEARPLDSIHRDAFIASARASHEKQAELEAGDTISFAEYLERYFAQRIR